MDEKNNLILVKDEKGVEFYLSSEYGEEDLRKCQKKSVEMMGIVVGIFEKYNIDYVLAHGTLLGLIRHNGFIPWDDDCDLFVFDWDYARAVELLRRELPEDMIVHNRRTDPIYWPKWTKIRDLYSDTYESMWKIDRKFKFHGICVDILKVTVMNEWEYENEEKIKKIQTRIKRRSGKMKGYNRAQKLRIHPKAVIRNKLDKLKLQRYEAAASKRKDLVCIGNKDTVIECSFKYEDVFPVKKMVFEGVEVAVPNNPDGVLRSMYGDYMEMPQLADRKPHFDKVIFLNKKQ